MKAIKGRGATLARDRRHQRYRDAEGRIENNAVDKVVPMPMAEEILKTV
jgi:hypothetical protein